MLLTHRPTKTIITGKSGSGKTTYFQRLIANGWQKYWPTVFLYDWQGEMAQRLNVQPVFRITELPNALKQNFVCFDPSLEFEGAYEQGLLFFARWCFEVAKVTTGTNLLAGNETECRSPRLFCCDEVQALVGGNCPQELMDILQTGRRWGIDMAIVSQQLNEMPNTFRNQMTERVTFQHEDPYVLSVMGSWGFDQDVVAQLNVGEYLYRNDRGEYFRRRLF